MGEKQLKVGSLFTGYGGLDLPLLTGPTATATAGPTATTTTAKLAWYCENDMAARLVLRHRFPGVPNLKDVTKVDWSQVERVDILTGGSPCQDISTQGGMTGMTDTNRSGLWRYMAEAVSVMKPQHVLWENVRGALSEKTGALHRVLGDLADLGYDAQWGVVRASDAGLPHRRERVFVWATTANPEGQRFDGGQGLQFPALQQGPLGGAPTALVPSTITATHPAEP